MWNRPEAHVGELLRVRFMEPLGLSASVLAKRCGMPRSRVSDILAGKRGISADTALRFAAFFRMDPADWMAFQAEWELGQAVVQDGLVPLDPPGFLVGPMGATRMPRPLRAASRPTLRVSPAALERLQASVADRPDVGPREMVEIVYPGGMRAMVSTPLPQEGEVPVIPVEELVLMKLRASRSQDVADVGHLVRAGLDVGAVLNFLGAHSPALATQFAAIAQRERP